jgi:hypothetical protein
MEESAPDLRRQQVQPGLAVTVDGSLCIVLEAGMGDSARRVTLSDCDDVTRAMELARVFVRASEDDAYAAKRLSAGERRG